MDITDANLVLLSQYLGQTLSHEQQIRRPAEQFLESIETTRNFPILLLHLIGKHNDDLTIRVSGSIAFKNYIKRNWVPNENMGYVDRICEEDRKKIKENIVELMLNSPPSIQKQLSDAISIIGKQDFPQKWESLINEMVLKFQLGDHNHINGILQTAHSIFKRYRYEFKSQKLWEEIAFVLNGFAKPFTELATTTMTVAQANEHNPIVLKIVYGSLVQICKIFYSLNAQDLPEYFEDNMKHWMNIFHGLLIKDVPCLHTDDDDEGGVLEQLRSQICYNLCMYAQKYDEEFSPFMPQFVTDIWELLVRTGSETKYDSIVSNALQFLSTVADRAHYKSLFEKPEVLSSLCEKVIIPNMNFRESDEELFINNPEEYIRRDIEGSDVCTRRRAACDLVKTLSQNFEEKIFAIFSEYLRILLGQYKENPQANWRLKDTVIYLVTTLTSRGSTEKHGVTQISELIPLPEFCQQEIIYELERVNIEELPVLKADALKFMMTFRTQLGAQTLAYLPQFIRHLQSPSVVVHTYAANAIEKLLVMRNSNNQMTVTNAQLQPYAIELLQRLFNVLQFEGSTENEYVMKAIMRSFYCLEDASMPFMGYALPRLNEILIVIAKNPTKPHFNHYLFETLSLSIKIVCKSNSLAVSSFEEVLFPVFQQILQQDTLEFMPYVFQMLSLILEIRDKCNTIIPVPYWALFPCLLSPTLWDRPGNITPLIRLLNAFIKQGSKEIAELQKLNSVLGIFQKMIASKSNDHEGFYLIQNLILYYPMNELQPQMRQIFSLLFQRLSTSKTSKFVRCLIVFFSFYAAKIGGQQLVDLIDDIQAGMFGMVIERVLITDMAKVSGDIDKKIVAIGITNLLCDCMTMLNGAYAKYWVKLLQCVIELFEFPPDRSTNESDHFIEIDDAPGYQAVYSKLNFAELKPSDPFESITTDGGKYLVTSLTTIFQQYPNARNHILGLPEVHQHALQKYCLQNNLNII